MNLLSLTPYFFMIFSCLVKQTSKILIPLTLSPILSRMPRHHDLAKLLDRLTNKLASWKAKKFIVAGQITVAKSVLSVISTHIVQCFASL